MTRHGRVRKECLLVAVSISQLFLACVFALAGTAKVLEPSATRRAVESFGVATRLAPAAVVMLPLSELGVAVALVVPATARWGALAALALLGVFSFAIIRALRSGAAPDCNCFGAVSHTEVGRGVLMRDAFLALVAAFAYFGAGSQPIGAVYWVTTLAAPDRPVVVALVACLGVLSWFCWRLLRQNGRLLLELDGQVPQARELPPLPVGAPAPEFSGRDMDHARVSLSSLLEPGLPLMLLFTDPGCGSCGSALEIAAAAQRERASELTVAVISTGSVPGMRERSTQLGLSRVVPQQDEALLDAYRVAGVPATVLIGSDGRLARPLALGADAVREAVAYVVARLDPGDVGTTPA